MPRRLFCGAFAILVACTSVGKHDQNELSTTNFGPEETLRICVLMDTTEISMANATWLLKVAQDEFLRYNLRVEVPSYTPFQRPSGSGSGTATIRELAALKLAPPCDRIMARVGHNWSDTVTGFLGVEVFGEVDTVTHTRGYIKADVASLSQILYPPEEVILHETYHLLGCAHDLSLSACYKRIATLKEARALNRSAGRDFFPTYSRTGQIIYLRESVDTREANALRVSLERERNLDNN